MTTTSNTLVAAEFLGLRPRERSKAFAGAITLFAGLIVLVDLGWFFAASSFFLIQLPILLLGLVLLLFFGTGFLLNPPVWVGAFLMTLLYFFQDFTLRQGLVAGGGMDLQSMLKGMLALLLLLYGLFNGLTRSFKHPVLAAFFAYAAFAAYSATYSSAPALGIGSGIALLGIVFATARAATMGMDILVSYWRALYFAAVIMCVGSFIVFAALPGMAMDLADPGAFRLRGLTGSANSLGPIMAVGSIAAITMYRLTPVPSKKFMHSLFFVLMMAALVLSNSRSTLIGLAVGLIAASLIGRKQAVLTLLLALFAATIGFAIFAFPSLSRGVIELMAELVSRSGSVEELTSLTGRSEIWVACVKLISEKPWAGYGLGSVRLEIPRVFQDEWGNSAATAHNFVLESLISVGVVGTVFLVMTMLIPTVELIRMVGSRVEPFKNIEQREWAFCALRCFLMLWVHSAAERAFAGTVAPSTVVLGVCVATYVMISLGIKAQRQARMARNAGLR
jgi:O-antigen ligase